MELNYPIKYAVLELKEKGKVIGYIPSKCYIVESDTKYFGDGSSKNIHRVVFPFTDVEEYKHKIYYDYETKDIGTPSIPMLDLSGNYYPVKIVEKLYDDYDSAYAVATVNNIFLEENMLTNIIPLATNPMYQKEKEEILLKHSLNMTLCEKFEKLVREQTKNMKVFGEEYIEDSEDIELRKQNIKIYINQRIRFK